ncbi:MAG: CDP-alcohol phosphatidyltransferase family protein [Treponema sp.]|nr:CDP-alcohol phosphatidyltransferase family protein [Treponema sp.]
MNENKIITFPNVLSVSRIILSPIIFFTKDNRFLLFSVLIIIGLTDVLDGYIARKYKKQTIIGSRLDSIADFVFYALLVIYTIIFGFNIIIKIKYCIIIIIGLKNTIAVEIGLYISIISSLEELIITIIGEKYEENIKGIWEIKKIKVRGHFA